MNKLVMLALAAGVAVEALAEAKALALLGLPVVVGPRESGPVIPCLPVLDRAAVLRALAVRAGARPELVADSNSRPRRVLAPARRGSPAFTMPRARSTRRSLTRSRNT
jgi:hypothetical protein